MLSTLFKILILFDGSTPPPPYLTASVSAIGFTYQEGHGPSSPSSTFTISGGGLVPSAGNVTVTPGTYTEVWDGSAWQSAPFTIAYTGGAFSSSSIYMARLIGGLSNDSYLDTIVISGGGASPFTINITGLVTASPALLPSPLYDYYHYV